MSMARRGFRVFAWLLIAGGVLLAAWPIAAGSNPYFAGVVDFAAKFFGVLLVVIGGVTLYVTRRGQAVTFDLHDRNR
jgi:hypothetical protein